jgi:metal-responsive CopG/Arc/MetJ family transcriptional regulator
MSSSFAAIVEEIKALSFPEKQELDELIEKYWIEERSEEIYQSYIHTLSEIEDKNRI